MSNNQLKLTFIAPHVNSESEVQYNVTYGIHKYYYIRAFFNQPTLQGYSRLQILLTRPKDTTSRSSKERLAKQANAKKFRPWGQGIAFL